MEYQVPQFIEVENKIFGPLTLRQFVFLAGGVGMCVGLILYLPFIIGAALSVPIMGLALALAFYKVNNKSFLDILEAGFIYYTGGRLYLWKKEQKSETPAIVQATVAPVREKLGLSQGKLKDLAWSLDIQDHTKPPETL
ncbi:MAG: seg [Parcubacteria group bacterium]|nr:seg [Parcubacteria group bacterium]